MEDLFSVLQHRVAARIGVRNDKSGEIKKEGNPRKKGRFIGKGEGNRVAAWIGVRTDKSGETKN